jgi:predicted RND superfamily exporter protein
MNAFNYYYKETGDIAKATESSILIIGKSILINAISVGVGFSILIFSHLIPMRYMGLLIALSMLFSSIGALTLLPVLINMRFKRRRLKGLE